MKMSNSSGIKKLSELSVAGMHQPGEKTEAKAKAEMKNRKTQEMVPPVKLEPVKAGQPDHGGVLPGIGSLRFDPESLVRGIVYQIVLGEPRCRRRGWR
jgi:hypothetical protein